MLSLFTPGIALAEPQSPTALTDAYIIVFKDDVNPKAEVPECCPSLWPADWFYL
jgi:hypothetical protein